MTGKSATPDQRTLSAERRRAPVDKTAKARRLSKPAPAAETPTSPNLDAFYASIALSGRTYLSGRGEPNDRLSDFEAKLVRVSDDEQVGAANDEEFGVLTGRFLNVAAAVNAGEWLVDIFDCDGDEDYGYGDAVFTDDDWRPEIVSSCELPPSNLLVFYRMKLHHSLRGYGVGLAFMKAVLASSSIPSETLVLIKPFALGHRDESAAQRTGTAKLAKYWRRAGFRRIGRSAFLQFYCP